MIVLVSACLLGINCRYDGRNSRVDLHKLKQGDSCLVPVCPEQLGGLPTPRQASRIVGGDGFDVLIGKARVLNSEGKDVTENFISGAYETLSIAMMLGVDLCYFKNESPSCGLRLFDPETQKRSSIGVVAALLLQKSFKIQEVKAKAKPRRISKSNFEC